MSTRVGIVGHAQTRNVSRDRDRHLGELIYETVAKALEETGIGIEEIDAVIGAGCDMLDGRSISNVFISEAEGAFLKEESKIEEDGAYAALYAYMRLLSGACSTALVVAYSKGSESSPQTYSGATFDPFTQRPLGLEAVSASALQARRYMDRYGATEEQAAKVSVKNHGNALRNPHAQVAMEHTLDDVLSSPILCSPIKRLDASPVSDGCSVLIMAAEDRARAMNPRPAWIRGVGYCCDAYYLGHRDLAEIKACEEAARTALGAAGISNPRAEIDVAEVYEAFSFQELMLYEALGFCPRGEGGRFIDDGVSEMGGDLPVNPSGGALGANAILSAGLVRMIEAARQVSGTAGEMQVQGARTALAHSTSGMCLQSNIVYILGSD